MQKHNLNPLEQPLRPPSLPPPETRRRKARRKELEAGVPGTGSDDSSQLPEEAVDSKDRQGGSTGASDAEVCRIRDRDLVVGWALLSFCLL